MVLFMGTKEPRMASRLPRDRLLIMDMVRRWENALTARSDLNFPGIYTII